MQPFVIKQLAHCFMFFEYCRYSITWRGNTDHQASWFMIVGTAVMYRLPRQPCPHTPTIALNNTNAPYNIVQQLVTRTEQCRQNR